jgi:hypothetical protein
VITINVTKMFSHREPWDCSNSIANLGDQAARLTWLCATEVAEQALRDAPDNWRVESVGQCMGFAMADAREAGWDSDEVAAWSEVECLAYLVQCVARDLRMLGSDDHELAECVARYEATGWEAESECPQACFYMEGDQVMAQLAR